MKIGSITQYKLKNITLSVKWTVPGLSKFLQKHTSKNSLNHYFYCSFLFLVAIFNKPILSMLSLDLPKGAITDQ